MTPVNSQRGFTIVEIILFLALSGLIFIIGFSGVSGRNQAVQFTDSIRNMDSFMQAQLNDVFNGVNEFSSGGSGDMVLLGKAFEFDSDRVVVHTLAGDRLTDKEILDRQGELDPDRWLVYDSAPQIVGTVETPIDWGTTFHSANIGASDSAFNGFVVMRSPNSSRLFAIAYSGAGATPNFNLAGTYEPSSSSVYGYLDSPEVYLCFEGAIGQYAAIGYGADERDGSLEDFFDLDYSPDTGYASCAPKESI